MCDAQENVIIILLFAGLRNPIDNHHFSISYTLFHLFICPSISRHVYTQATELKHFARTLFRGNRRRRHSNRIDGGAIKVNENIPGKEDDDGADDE